MRHAFLRWLLLVALLACGSGGAEGRVEKGGGAAVTSGDEARPSQGMTVATGGAPMNGTTEVECSLQQAGDDFVRLSLSVRSDCATQAPLLITVRTVSSQGSVKVPIALDEQSPRPIEGPLLPLPPAGSLVRTQISARCVGTRGKEVWASGRCAVQRNLW